jgi:hypothetical protein
VDLVARDRTGYLGGVLLHGEVVRRVAVEVGSGERLVAIVPVDRRLKFVGAALGDDVDDATGIVAELDVESVVMIWNSRIDSSEKAKGMRLPPRFSPKKALFASTPSI